MLVFPGQGSQSVGMAKDFYNTFQESKDVIDRIDDALGQKLSELMFNGPIDELTKTENAQPAIMAASAAIYAALRAHTKKSPLENAKYLAGHSLGEFTALYVANSITLEDTARILKIRGKAMQEVAGEGAMTALLGFSPESLSQILYEGGKLGVCQLANDNNNDQVVISGDREAIEWINTNYKKFQIKKAIPLNVSAPFHCTTMKPAAHKLEQALQEITIKTPEVPIITNVTAKKESDPATIKQLLVMQAFSTVRWKESIQYAISNNVCEFIEIGNGNVLTKIIKKIDKEVAVASISTPEDLELYISTIETA